MFNAHCLVCSDKNSFRGKVFSLKNVENRILNLISIYLRKLNCKDLKVSDELSRKVRYGVSNEHSHLHLMCGYCPEVDNNSLRRLDESIHQSLAVICTILKDDRLSEDDKRRLYHETLQSFRGYYPISYRFLEKYYHKEVIKR